MNDKEILEKKVWGVPLDDDKISLYIRVMQLARQDERERINKELEKCEKEINGKKLRYLSDWAEWLNCNPMKLHGFSEAIRQDERQKLQSEIAGLRKEKKELEEQLSYYESNRNTLYDKIVEHNNQLKLEIATLKSKLDKSMKFIEFKRDECSDHIRFSKDITEEEKDRCRHALSTLNQIHLFMQGLSEKNGIARKSEPVCLICKKGGFLSLYHASCVIDKFESGGSEKEAFSNPDALQKAKKGWSKPKLEPKKVGREMKK
jgi:chromosome segregation ATPase